MKKLKVKRSWAIIALMMVSITYGSMAQRMQGPPRQDDKQVPPRMEQRELERGPKIPDLTEEQEVQLKELHVAMEKAVLPVQSQIAEKEARLKTITTASEINLKEAGRVIQEMSDLRAQLVKLRVENLAKIKEILTDEQELALNHQLLRRPDKRQGGKHGFERGR